MNTSNTLAFRVGQNEEYIGGIQSTGISRYGEFQLSNWLDSTYDKTHSTALLI